MSSYSSYKSSLTWKVQADITYNPPCEGCLNCLTKKVNTTNQKWFQRFSKDKSTGSELLRTLNPDCATEYEKKVETSDLVISTSNNSPYKDTIPKLHLNIGPKSVDYIDFVKQGWKSENKQKRDIEEKVDARVVQIKPNVLLNEGKEAWFSIDNDDFEVKPIRITLLPNFIKMFCKKENNIYSVT